MFRGLAVIVPLAFTYAVTMFQAEQLSPYWLLSAQLLLALIGLVAGAWAFGPARKRSS